MNNEDLFKNKLGQTSPFPFAIEVERAEGLYIYDKHGNAYADLISGVAVSALGHGHPRIKMAIKAQVDRYMHVMVYGEFIQNPQLLLAERLTALLPYSLQSVYPLNSGTEANEAAMKLCKRFTERGEIIAFKGSYHGNTQGSMSISFNEMKKKNFRPLLPGVTFIELNNFKDLEKISKKTAGVFLETIQGDAGVRIPTKKYLQALRNKCNLEKALLVFDEIQCGMGRTGKMFAFEHFDVVPDILTLGKALGGGMPIGALVSSKKILDSFQSNPMLGHITTFGGHPVICAAAAECLDIFKEEISFGHIQEIAEIFITNIASHPEIIENRNMGLLMAFDMVSAERVSKVVNRCIEKQILTFWFLSHPHSFRLSPPLNISKEEANRLSLEIFNAIEETK